jgi:hypothetical protein
MKLAEKEKLELIEQLKNSSNSIRLKLLFDNFNKRVSPTDFLSEKNIDLFDIDLEGGLKPAEAIIDLIVRTFDDYLYELFDVDTYGLEKFQEIAQYVNTPNLTETMLNSNNFKTLKNLLSNKYSKTLLTNSKIKRVLKMNGK